MSTSHGEGHPENGLARWLRSNTYHHADYFPHDMMKLQRNMRIIVIIPAREVALTIRAVLEKTVRPLTERGIVDEVFVIDANSVDRTGDIARACGATVLQRSEIATELGPSLGKGDAMWRALLATSQSASPTEIVAFLDGDTRDPTPAHLEGLLGPFLTDDRLQMVKGCFERPFMSANGELRANDGGRVTELAARPLLNLHFPNLAGFSQPLAGEFAARRGLLEQLMFPVGYGIEIGTLIDAHHLVGLEALAQCDLGTRQNEHKSLRDLTPMAFAVTGTLERRLQRRTSALLPRSECSSIFLPWEGRARKISDVERPAVRDYLQTAGSIPLDCHSVGMERVQQGSKEMTPTICSPFISIEGIPNFRDVGGYPTKSGHIVRRRLVFRSGALNGLTLNGLAVLRTLRIEKVFDLRSPNEVDRSCDGDVLGGPVQRGSRGPDIVQVPIFSEQDYSPEALARRFRDYACKGTEGFERAYASILQNAAPAIRNIIEHLTETEDPSPILVHCTAGKDRTGVIIMILLLLAGCDDSTVAQDYSLTEIGLGDEWKAATVNRLAKHAAFQNGDLEGIHRMVGAHKDNMLAVISNLRRNYGEVEGYLKRIGIDEEISNKCSYVLQQREK